MRANLFIDPSLASVMGVVFTGVELLIFIEVSSMTFYWFEVLSFLGQFLNILGLNIIPKYSRSIPKYSWSSPVLLLFFKSSNGDLDLEARKEVVDRIGMVTL